MGYTHYLRNKNGFSPSKWKKLQETCRKVFTIAILEGIELQPLKGREFINDDSIAFDGGSKSCDQFQIVKEATKFTFTKTNKHPYDQVVVACYLLARHFGNRVQLSSDGNTGPGIGFNPIPNDFAEGEALVFRATGLALKWPQD